MALTFTVLRCPDAVPPETRTVMGGEFTVGRGPGVDWVLPDPERLLSKHHFAVAYRGGNWQIADTSTNGTTLNRDAAPIGHDAVRNLRDGDRIVAGAYEIEVRLAEDAAPQAGFGGGLGFGAPPPARGASPFADPFAQDVFAPPPPARRPFDEAPSPGFGALPTAAQLPHDFDPLGSEHGEAAFLGPTQADHGPVLEDAFTPPAASGQMAFHSGGKLPGDDLLPDDWDKDLLEGINPSSAPSAAPFAAQHAPAPEAFAPPAQRPPAPAMAPPSMPPRMPTAPAAFAEPMYRPAAPLADPFAEPAAQPAMQPLVQPLVQPAAQPLVQPVSQPVVQPIVQPVTQPFVQPIAQPFAQPVVQPIAQPFAQPVTQPFAQPVVQSVVQPAPHPAAPPMARPMPVEAQDPFAEPAAPSHGRMAEAPVAAPAAGRTPTPFDEPFELEAAPARPVPPSPVIPPQAAFAAVPPQAAFAAGPHAPPAASQAAAAPSATPSAADGALLAAFLHGVGMTDVKPADPASMMHNLGEAFRTLVA
ncbi:MAG TPA: FHA domain-containing protein, partial [Acetobacteraceae bacterium]|nr:FHA domain-containing protein [Acetobacteraceae bacterium]